MINNINALNSIRFINRTKTPNFKGLEENIETGNKVVKEIKEKHLHSSSKLDLYKMYHPEAVQRHQKLFENTKGKIAFIIDNGVRKDFDKNFAFDNPNRPTTVEELAHSLEETMEKHHAGNCMEQAHLARFKLMERGKNSDCIGIETHDWWKTDEAGRRGALVPEKTHLFVVMDMKPDANLSNPDTWGEDAVIVDPWNGFTAPVKEGLEKINKVFQIDKTHEQVNFFKDNPDSRLRKN